MLWFFFFTSYVGDCKNWYQDSLNFCYAFEQWFIIFSRIICLSDMDNCCGLTLTGSWAPQICSFTLPPPPAWLGWRRGFEVWKLVCWDRDSLTGQAKAVCNKQSRRNSFTTSHELFSHFLESRAPSHPMLTWRANGSELLSSLRLICWAWGHMIWNVPLVGWGRLSSCVSSQIPVHPQSPHWGGWVKSRKGLDSVLALLSSSKTTPVLSTKFSAQIQNYFEEH